LTESKVPLYILYSSALPSVYFTDNLHKVRIKAFIQSTEKKHEVKKLLDNLSLLGYYKAVKA